MQIILKMSGRIDKEPEGKTLLVLIVRRYRLYLVGNATCLLVFGLSSKKPPQ